MLNHLGGCTASLRRGLSAALLGVLYAASAHAGGGADLQSLQSQLDGLGARIQRLQDLTEVEILQHAYGYYVDKAQWRSLSDLFAEDATLEIGGKGVFLGRKRVFEYMTVGLGPIGPHDGLLIDHQQFQCRHPLHRIRDEFGRLGPRLL